MIAGSVSLDAWPSHGPLNRKYLTVPEISESSFLGRNEFLIRRLHSLSGLIPVGAYMVVHLITNSTVLAGSQTFQSNVNAIHALGPILPLVEWGFIFLPIIFHAVVGVLIMRNYAPNTSNYPYAKNIRYTLQRATAWIALAFIFWHVFHMHGWIKADYWISNVADQLNGARFDPHHATSTASAALQPALVIVLYIVGVLACVYHLANGLWTMGITWGLWTTPAAMRRADRVCIGFGLLLAVISMAALYGMVTVDPIEARATEDAMLEQDAALQSRQEALLQELRNDNAADAPAQP
jgi:succinate dehydrogenase / fumarate reductase cytochrome b subunit